VSPAHDPAELERRLADAREQGHEQGRAQALEQLAAERAGLAQAAKALAAALARLERPSPDQVAVLARAMDAAVTRLATERAGIAIDRAPAGFARRVSRLAERLACHPGRVTVRLHPDDLAAIQPFLADDGAPDISALAGARLVGDPGLQRGDADLETAGIRIADLAGTDAGDDGE
jgi:flagellar assembly protein FliH